MTGIKNKKRLIALFIVIAIVFLALMIRIGYWTFVKGSWLQTKGESQWTQDEPVAANRGSILDRNGGILAQSASADTVLLRPQQIKDADEVADKLSEILEMDRSTVYEKAADTTKQEVWLKRQITREQAARIEALGLKGVVFTSDVKRYYPYNELLTQVIGFTSVDGDGQTGIEKEYNKYLAGKQGRVISETDKSGRELSSGNELYVDPVDGYNVTLTIDTVIQSFLEKACTEAYESFGAKGVEGIVMDPNTGEVLAMANIPGYDLNDPPRDDMETLEENSRNKTTSDVYEPGSTFKIITTASALDSGAATMDSTYNCQGYYMVDGEKIKCWRTTPHGTQTLTEAVQNSCNPCFMQMGLSMGLDTFYQYIYNYGFGEGTGIDFTSDASGIVTNQKYVKNVDLARIAFGQSIAVTPLQLAAAVSATVNGGYLYQPMLALSMTDSEGNTIEEYQPVMKRQVISEDTSAKMRQILQSVVDNGSGRNAQVAGYAVGGKTGTAQKYEDGAIAEGKVISSFIGFAPADDPEYVVLILVDEPQGDVTYGSVVAAPYVKQVLEQVLPYANIPADYSPEEVVYATVPSVVGVDSADAKLALEEAGFTVTVNGSGAVASQIPAAEESVAAGSNIILYTENYTEGADGALTDAVQVPDVTGMTVKAAQETLAAAGFEIEVRSSGKAVRQEPAATEYADKGSVVKVYFALDIGGDQ